MSQNKITDIKGRMVFDSRGLPTVEAEISVNDKYKGIAISPSGASKGKNEAVEIKDNKDKFFGNSIDNNIHSINTIIKENLIGFNIEDQKTIDETLIELDGTTNKSNLGANTLIAVSMAALRAASVSNKCELWSYLNVLPEKKLPIPEIQIIGGGAHAKGSIRIQDFMIIPNGAPDFYTALHWVFKVYKKTGEKLLNNKKLFGVADEGGYWPYFDNISEVLNFLTQAIEESGFKPFKEISISLDIAANNFKKNKNYQISKKAPYIDADELCDELIKLINNYPIISIEDPFAEEDIDYFIKLKKKSPSYLQIVGDDLVVTNTKLIESACKKNAINSILIKPNQIGTITEAFYALKLSKELGLMSILSARSGETEDSFIADLCVGWNMKQFKVGSLSRSERLSKWNQCLRIGENFKNKYAMHESKNIWKL